MRNKKWMHEKSDYNQAGLVSEWTPVHVMLLTIIRTNWRNGHPSSHRSEHLKKRSAQFAINLNIFLTASHS